MFALKQSDANYISFSDVTSLISYALQRNIPGVSRCSQLSKLRLKNTKGARRVKRHSRCTHFPDPFGKGCQQRNGFSAERWWGGGEPW